MNDIGPEHFSLMTDYFQKYYTSAGVRRASYNSHYIQLPHRHDFPQLWYCHKGSYVHNVGGHNYECSAGTFIIAPPGVMHGFELDGGEEVILTCIDTTYYFFGNKPGKRYTNILTHLFLPEFDSELGFEIPKIYAVEDGELTIAEEIFEKLNSTNYSVPFNTDNFKSLLCALFDLSPFKLDNSQRVKATMYLDKKFNGVMEAIRYINFNYSQKLLCSDVLKVACVCRTGFFQMIKKATGFTFSIYAQTVRIVRIRGLLALTDLSFQYLADTCGFPNVPYLSRVYKNRYGMSLSDARSHYPKNRVIYPKLLLSRDWLEDYRAFSCR